MSDRTPSTGAALDRVTAPLRRLGQRTVVLGAAGAAFAALGLPAILARFGVIRSPVWVLIAWVLTVLVVAIAGIAARRVIGRFRHQRMAVALEDAPGWRRGAITARLEGRAAGTSGALFEAADQSCADEIDQRGPESLAQIRASHVRQARWALGAAVVGSLLVLGSAPWTGPGSAVWFPGRAWATLIAPVTLVFDRAQVDRGDSVVATIRASGRDRAELWLRGKGELWRREMVDLDSTGRSTRTLGPLAGDLFAFIQAGGRTSDTVSVRVRLPAFLGRLALTAKYPAYLKLDDEPLPTSGDTLLLPAGTRIETRGETTADLARASWSLAGGTTDLTVTGREFAGNLIPRRSGLAELSLATADGAPLGSDPIRLPIEVVPDRPPVVEVPVPGQDTLALLGTEVAMVIDVRDDHGLTGVAISGVRARAGNGQTVSTRLELPAGTTDRALISTKYDVQAFGLTPGDTLTYWVTARDNAPAAQTGRSKIFVLIVPTKTEARTEQKSASSRLSKRLDSLVAESKQLQRQTEDLSQERQRGSQTEKGDPSLNFEEAKRAEQVAKDQQELLDRAEEAREQLDKLEDAADRSGVADSAFRRQLDEIRDQLNKALTPELRKKLEELRQSLKNLDPQGTKDALQKLAEAQQKLREALERTRDLFKRAALEGEMSSLEQETKEVAKQQEEWNQKVGAADSTAAAAEEQGLSQRADSVAKGLEEAAKQLDKGDRKDALKQTADQVKQASQQMQQASKSARAGKRQQAKQQGEEAAQKLNQAQKEVKEQKEDQQNEWRQEVVAAIDRALAETARLSQRQLALSNSIGRGAAITASRLEQGVIEEGVQKLLEQVLAVSGKNALISPQISAALVQARLQMARARDAISSASANLREASEQAGEAVDALNVAAYNMLRSRDDVAGSSSGSGLAEAMQKMQQLAGQQGSLSQEGNNLLSMLGQQQVQQQMQLMAQRQRQLAQELERLRAQSQIPGSRDLAEEARELARKLEAGRLDRETVERQERLFKRMLDAGRMLQGQEQDEKKERQSETAKGDSVSIPAPLRRLLDRDGQIRLPTWEDLQRLSPEERRLVTDYFRRLTSKEPG